MALKLKTNNFLSKSSNTTCFLSKAKVNACNRQLSIRSIATPRPLNNSSSPSPSLSLKSTPRPVCAQIRSFTNNSKSKYTLTKEQLAFWDKNGYLVAGNISTLFGMDPSTPGKWVDTFATWDSTVKGKWLLHRELVNGQKQLCRVENFANFHQEANDFLRKTLCDLVSQLYREPAVLFKEKVNFKLAGGAGFAAHQDTPAYIGLANSHISVMVAIDAATKQNGCLQVSAGRYGKGDIPLTKDGIVTKEFDQTLKYDFVECKPGDILFFDGYLPHRSDANNSSQNRRAMFLTYNKLSEGDFHAQYYAAKHASKAGFDKNKTISFQGDFQGQVVD